MDERPPIPPKNAPIPLPMGPMSYTYGLERPRPLVEPSPHPKRNRGGKQQLRQRSSSMPREGLDDHDVSNAAMVAANNNRVLKSWAAGLAAASAAGGADAPLSAGGMSSPVGSSAPLSGSSTGGDTTKEDPSAVLPSDTVTCLKADSGGGWTPLHVAASVGNIQFAAHLISEGAQLDARTPNGGVTPLHIAAMNSHYLVASMLTSAGANVELKTYKDGLAALHIAADRPHYLLVATLINAGADVNARTKEGLTPLHYASRCGFKENASLLLDNGAQVNAVDKQGRTPLQHLYLEQKNGGGPIDPRLLRLRAEADAKKALVPKQRRI